MNYFNINEATTNILKGNSTTHFMLFAKPEQ